MGFQVAVVFYSRHGRLAVLANVIAEGARQVPGAEVMVYRVKDPIRHDSEFDEGVLDAPVATTQTLLEADALIMGAPGRQAGMCGEMRMFLDQLTEFQEALEGRGLKGKIGSAFTSVGGKDRGYGGHETILQSFHATYLHNGMIVVGTPPDAIMEDARMATPFGAVMAGKETADHQQSLNEQEVKLGFSLGRWTAQVAKLLHDSEM